jgi:hypothetical protein
VGRADHLTKCALYRLGTFNVVIGGGTAGSAVAQRHSGIRQSPDANPGAPTRFSPAARAGIVEMSSPKLVQQHH